MKLARLICFLLLGVSLAPGQAVINGARTQPEISAGSISNPPANSLTTFVCDDGGTTKLCSKDSAGTVSMGLGGGYSSIEEEGTPLTTRTSLNFEGSAVTCADDTTKTTCTITSGGGWTRGSAVDATNGGANDLTTFTVLSGLTSPDQIEIAFSGISLSGTENFQIQIGDSGGIETAGYESTSIHVAVPGGSLSGHSDTAAYAFRGGAADMVTSGSLVLTRVDGNTWTINGTYHNVSAGLGFFWVGTTSGVKTLSGTLTQVLMKSAGTNTFDGGTVTGMYQ